MPRPLCQRRLCRLGSLLLVLALACSTWRLDPLPTSLWGRSRVSLPTPSAYQYSSRLDRWKTRDVQRDAQLLDSKNKLRSPLMISKPFISVVIPTFNRATQVRNALNSVLAQKYQEFEIIVVDDGSTDETGDSIQEIIRLQGDGGKRIRYFFQPNQGSSVARNKGIEQARGEWIAFLDSDALWVPEK